MNTFEMKLENSKKYRRASFYFDGEWFDTFNNKEDKRIDRSFIDDFYEIFGNKTFNPYYEIEDTLNNLKTKYFVVDGYQYSWGDFVAVNTFMSLVNYVRKIANIDYATLSYKEPLNDLIDKYLNAKEVVI
jgi:hypothetical protein